jgi:DNA-binding CsgD family transcriptional regulator
LLRHTYVTAMLDAGVSLRDVQIAARHADPRTTMCYDRARRNLDRHPIRAVHAGHVLMNADVAHLLAAGDGAPPGAALTPRESDVLVEIARGRSNREIARALNVSEKTVKTHVSAIFTNSAWPTAPRPPCTPCRPAWSEPRSAQQYTRIPTTR